MNEVQRRLTKDEVKQKKIDVCNAIIMHPYSITKALQQADVSKSTYYKWKKEDSDFGLSLENWDDAMVDFAEKAAMKRVKDGSDAIIKFVLETKGQKRGWSKTSKVESTVTQTNVISIPAMDPKDWDSIAALQQKALKSDKELTIDVKPDGVPSE